MRCSSTVSAPVQHCCAPLTAHHSRYIAVRLLTNQNLYFVTETKSKTKDVYTQICLYLAGQGMLDCELFGLAIVYDGEYLFVDPESKLSKYAPKNWKSSSSHGLDGHGNPAFVLYFRVQFYMNAPFCLRDDFSRHNYYLQLRDNVLTRGQVTFCVNDELLLLLAGYALQADYGDFSECIHNESYFEPSEYFPKELIARNSQITKMAAVLHKNNHGMTAAEAEMLYIKEASSGEISFLSHNLHLYKLKSHKKQSSDDDAVWLAVCARGIQIHEVNRFKKCVSTTFLWNNIGKLCFDRKKFEIRTLSSAGEKMTYYTSSDEKSKHLLLLCRFTHQFSLSHQWKPVEVNKQEGDDAKKKAKKSKKICSAKSDEKYSTDVSSIEKFIRNSSKTITRDNDHTADQRISVISNTSSNTTSGIASDRVQSFDGSEDDSEIRRPVKGCTGDPADNLKESSTNGPMIQDTQSASSFNLPTAEQVLEKGATTFLEGPATLVSTDESQCSGTGSTTALADYSSLVRCSTSSFGSAGNEPAMRNGIPYGHTPRNPVFTKLTSDMNLNSFRQRAVVEELDSTQLGRGSPDELDGLFECPRSQGTQETLDVPGTEIYRIDTSLMLSSETVASNLKEVAVSAFGVNKAENLMKTLRNRGVNRSEVDVHSGAELSPAKGSGLDSKTGARLMMSPAVEAIQVDSRETSGVYDVTGVTSDTRASDPYAGYDVVNSLRKSGESNDSEESASDSFHGDGSDPVEVSTGTLLTADELSDLIVGRTKTHKSGKYPPRATISNSLDSDSDYVTLPPPPRLSSGVIDRLDRRRGERNETGINAPINGSDNDFWDEGHRGDGGAVTKSITWKQTPLKILTSPAWESARGLQISYNTASVSGLIPVEEANARFITTKPHVSMITHSNVPSSSIVPHYAFPPLSYAGCNSPEDPVANRMSQSTRLGCLGCIKKTHESVNFFGDDLLKMSTNQSKNSGGEFAVLGIRSCKASGLPVIGKNNYLDVHASKSESVVAVQGADVRRTVPVSPSQVPPSLANLCPSSGTLATVYTSQVTSSQIEQYKQQLYSDVDYVVYPMKDPALSKQEYMDAKQGSLLAALASGRCREYPPPPPYPRAKTHFMYRSTPDVTRVAGMSPAGFATRIIGKRPSQNLNQSHEGEIVDHCLGCDLSSSGCLFTKGGSLCSPVSYPYSSTPSLHHKSTRVSANHFPSHSPLFSIPGNSLGFLRARSDENILDSHHGHDSIGFVPASNRSGHRRRFSPPTPPPLPITSLPPTASLAEKLSLVPEGHGPGGNRTSSATRESSRSRSNELPGSFQKVPKSSDRVNAAANFVLTAGSCSPLPATAAPTLADKEKIVDICTLIEKSKSLDLPLISALCNDKSLLRQTNAFVMPKHPSTALRLSGRGSKDMKKKHAKELSWTGASSGGKPASDSFKSRKSGEGSWSHAWSHDPKSTVYSTRSNKAHKNASTLFGTIFSGKRSKGYSNSSKLKYPVSGLSTTQIFKPPKKTCGAHVHPAHTSHGRDNSSSGGNVTKPGKAAANFPQCHYE